MMENKFDLLADYKYVLLLVALLFFLVGYPIAIEVIDVPVLYYILLSVAFVVSMLAVLQTSRSKCLIFALGLPTIIGLWTEQLFPEINTRIVTSGFHLIASAFLLLTIGVVLRDVYRNSTVTLDGIAAGLCSYLLIGLTFSHLYSLFSTLVPGSFHGLGTKVGPSKTHFLLTYFSFSTLTTVGYGDIVPTRDTVRSLAFTEAIAGQFLLAVLIADLVGKRLAQTMRNPVTVD